MRLMHRVFRNNVDAIATSFFVHLAVNLQSTDKIIKLRGELVAFFLCASVAGEGPWEIHVVPVATIRLYHLIIHETLRLRLK